MPGLLKLFSEKCVCVCMYVCLSFCTHLSKTLEAKVACIREVKAIIIEPVLAGEQRVIYVLV